MQQGARESACANPIAGRGGGMVDLGIRAEASGTIDGGAAGPVERV